MLAKIRNTFTYKYLTFCGILTILSVTTIIIHAYNSNMWFKELYAIFMQTIVIGLLSLITIIPIIIDIVRRNKLTPRKSNWLIIGLEFITISIFLAQSYFVLFFIVPNLF